MHETAIPGYLPIIVNHQNSQDRGLGAYVKDGFPYESNPQNVDLVLSYMRYRITFIFTLYRPEDDITAMFDRIAETSLS